MKTVIEMAREAGIQDAHSRNPHTGVMAQLERFAELVRAEALAEQPAQPAVPDPIHHTTSETLEYIQGWNDCRALMLEMRKP
jgi:hypothetical protein